MNRRKYKRRQYILRKAWILAKKKKRRVPYNPEKHSSGSIQNSKPEPRKEYQVVAPKDFRLLKNTKECVEWFRTLRSMERAVVNPHGQKYQRIDLYDVEYIDFAATLVLGAILDDFVVQTPSCWCYGRLPKRQACAEYIKQSGFLNGKADGTGKPFTNFIGSESLKVERGQTRLEGTKIRDILSIEKHAAEHLIGEQKVSHRHIDVIKEICGNTFGWSNAFNRQWTLGAKFEDDKVVFVALDLGNGILESLSRRFFDILKDKFRNNSDKEILEGAFLRKYGSTSKDRNRNKGLPSIRKACEDGYIKDLCVLTNNVLLDYSDSSKNTKYINEKDLAFDGTVYSWRLDADCFK